MRPVCPQLINVTAATPVRPARSIATSIAPRAITCPKPPPPSTNAVDVLSPTIASRASATTRFSRKASRYCGTRMIPCDATPQASASTRCSATMRAVSVGTCPATKISVIAASRLSDLTTGMCGILGRRGGDGRLRPGSAQPAGCRHGGFLKQERFGRVRDESHALVHPVQDRLHLRADDSCGDSVTLRDGDQPLDERDHLRVLDLARDSEIGREIHVAQAGHVDPRKREHFIQMVEGLLPLDLNHAQRFVIVA